MQPSRTGQAVPGQYRGMRARVTGAIPGYRFSGYRGNTKDGGLLHVKAANPCVCACLRMCVHAHPRERSQGELHA